MKQQWITSNQAQSTEGVIMHTAAASLSLCKPSLSPSSLSGSLSLKALWAEWLICDYWFLENVGGIERERGRGRGREGGEEGASSILRSASLQLSPLVPFLSEKKTEANGCRVWNPPDHLHPSIPPFFFFFFFFHLPCSSLPFISPLPFSSSFSFPLLPPPPSLSPPPPKLSVNIQQKNARASLQRAGRNRGQRERSAGGWTA